MTKPTRDEQFRNSISNFMTNSLAYENLNYNIKCKTTNLRKSIHEYELKIPKETCIATINSSTINDIIYSNQELPINSTFIDDLITTFKPYVQFIDGNFISGTKVIVPDELLLNDPVDIIKIKVFYSTKTKILPYPLMSLSTTELIDDLKSQNVDILHRNKVLTYKNQKLINNQFYYENEINEHKLEIKELHNMLDDVENQYATKCSQYNNMKSDYSRFIHDQYIHHNRIISNFRKLYNNMNIKEDCPVCYDKIKSSELFMPICGHSICIKCSMSCKSKCPICRESYHGIDDYVYKNV